MFIADIRPSGGELFHPMTAVFSAHVREQDCTRQLADLIADAGFTVTGTGDDAPLNDSGALRAQE